MEQYLGESSVRCLAAADDNGKPLPFTFLEASSKVLFASCMCVVRGGFGMNVLPECSFQHRWHLWISFPSWRLHWGACAFVPLLSPKLLLTVLCPHVLQLNFALVCPVLCSMLPQLFGSSQWLPGRLCSSGCFASNVALGAPLMLVCVMAPASFGCFATFTGGVTMVFSSGCFAIVILALVDAVPP